MSPASGSYFVRPGRQVGGEARVPGDKSISHRAVMLAGIAEGPTEIMGFLASADCLATLAAMRAMGVEVSGRDGRLAIQGRGLHGLVAPSQALDLGNAGTAMRLLAGLLCGQRFDSTLVGDASLSRRPMERVAAPLRRMGADIRTHDGCAPLQIRGGRALRGCDHVLEVPSAQVKSALLLAGLYSEGETTLSEPSPSRDHTERMLRAFGADLESREGRHRLRPAPLLQGCSLEVPGDFSSAAFLMVAGLIAGKAPLVLRGVGINETRTGLLEILRGMGADLRLHGRRDWGAEPVADIEVRPSELQGIDVPAALVPLAIDEFPVLFAAAAVARGETRVTGAGELRVKESDRIAVMAKGLQALGIEASTLPDGMVIRGGIPGPGSVDSQGDHRIAMALAILAARASGPVEVRDVANVATSFPGFAGLAGQLGLDIEDGST